MHPLLKKYKAHFSDIPWLYDYQEEVIHRLLKRENTLAIIPTGGGKSLLYQLMSLELEGITLVVSPLLALMNEQVNELNTLRHINALALNSQISFVKQREILRTLTNASFKLVYVSPERLQNPFFRAALMASGVNISMIVIDEAHCISQWGSSFRPEYGEITGFIDFLKQNKQNPFLLCLTATLSQIAREDIMLEFNIEKENVFVTPKIIRDNLKLNFIKVDEEDDKEQGFKDFLLKHKPNKTLAYLYSKYLCETYSEVFSDTYTTDYFHAEVDTEEKESVYERFLNNEIDILFATTAFGMGINIPDIDSVVHIHIPHSVEEYYQHIGRGWRKKTVARNCQCLAMWSEKNFEERRRSLEAQKFNEQKLHELYKQLIGSAKIRHTGQIVNKDKNAMLNSSHELQLVRYKLEKKRVIRTIGEINGSPLDIEFNENTTTWLKIREAATSGMDSFAYVSKDLGITLIDIIKHLYEQDLAGNIKKLPATKKDIYFEILELEISPKISLEIVDEINSEVNFRINQLEELEKLFQSENPEQFINQILR